MGIGSFLTMCLWAIMIVLGLVVGVKLAKIGMTLMFYLVVIVVGFFAVFAILGAI